MRAAALILLGGSLGGLGFQDAAATSRGVLSPEQWQSAVRAHNVEPGEAANPLAVSPALVRSAHELAGVGSPLIQLDNLQEALFDERRFPFQYENTSTRTAVEAFESRAGNCLSFTNLFIAMGRSLGHSVRAALPRYVRRSEKDGDLIVVNEHIVATYRHGGGVAVFDFNQRRAGPPLALQPIDDLRLTALFLNNRGVERLLDGEIDGAIVDLTNTIRLAPDFPGAHGNLGVAHRRAGDLPAAFASYRQALELQPDDPTILANLATLYSSLGRNREAQSALAAANHRAAAPHVLLVQGDLRVQAGEIESALRLYRRAHRLARERPEALASIARVEFERGRLRAARRAAQRALQRDPEDDEVRRLLEQVEAARDND